MHENTPYFIFFPLHHYILIIIAIIIFFFLVMEMSEDSVDETPRWNNKSCWWLTNNLFWYPKWQDEKQSGKMSVTVSFSLCILVLFSIWVELLTNFKEWRVILGTDLSMETHFRYFLLLFVKTNRRKPWRLFLTFLYISNLTDCYSDPC